LAVSLVVIEERFPPREKGLSLENAKGIALLSRLLSGAPMWERLAQLGSKTPVKENEKSPSPAYHKKLWGMENDSLITYGRRVIEFTPPLGTETLWGRPRIKRNHSRL